VPFELEVSEKFFSTKVTSVASTGVIVGDIISGGFVDDK